MSTSRGGEPAHVHRDRARRRDTARLRAFLVLVVLLLGSALAVWLIVKQDTKRTTATPGPGACPGTSAAASGTPAVPVQVRVLNATTRQGLAASVAVDLRRRGYTVTGVGNDSRAVPGVAELRYGAGGAAAARVLVGVVPGSTSRPDKRAGPGVDLVLGNTFTRLAPVALKVAPTPSRCPSSATPTPSPKRA